MSQLQKKAFITGINGQDGSYLAELLLNKGYVVHGLVRRETFESGGDKLSNLRSMIDRTERISLHLGSANNQLLINNLISSIQPDECYHLAATSYVSYDLAAETSILENNFNSTHYLLASIKANCPKCRFYFAGSSEMFGQPKSYPQNEQTPYEPRSIYGISKVAAAQLAKNYRNQHDLFVCTGILFNHESPRRDYAFVTRKISSQVAKIAAGQAKKLTLGNLEAQRDWGYAPEYVEAMWHMLNHDTPDDYVIATGGLYSVRDIVDCAFSSVNLNYQDYIEISEKFHRPHESLPLVGDASKAKRILNWSAQKNILDIMPDMVASDLKLLKRACSV